MNSHATTRTGIIVAAAAAAGLLAFRMQLQTGTQAAAADAPPAGAAPAAPPAPAAAAPGDAPVKTVDAKATAALPGIGARDVGLLVRVLQLDDGQVEVIRVMLEDAGGGAGDALVPPAIADGIRAMLTPEQLKAWPEVERTLRRERLLGEGMLPGEAINVALVLEANVARSAWSAEMADAVAKHSEELDGLLVARSGGGRLDPSAAHALRRRIRDLNLALVETLAAGLPADRADAFRSEILRASYPTVFARTNGEIILGELDGPAYATVGAKVESIRDDYRRKLATVRAEAKAAVDARATVDPGNADELAKAQARVAAAEKGYGEAERWLAEALAAAIDVSSLPAGAGSTRVSEWIVFERASSRKAWGNAQAMLEVFDRDRDGELSEAEQQAAFDVYTRQVGARAPRKL